MMQLRKFLSCTAAVLALTMGSPLYACRIPDIRPYPWPPPVPHPSPQPALEPMLTRLHKAEIRIEDTLAKVTVTATFYNPNNTRVEGTYFFPIDPEAVVKDFAMTVNGKEQKAELLEAGKARKIYEEIVRKMRDPGLLEYVGTRMLKASVFPIEPRGEVQVRLNYTQVARSDAGLLHLRYPLSSAKPNAGKIDQLAVRVTLKSSVPIKLFYSPSHKIDTLRRDEREVAGGFEESAVVPDRDFDLYWSVDKADIGLSATTYRPKVGEDGFCLISLAPKMALAPNERQPKDIVFVFDKSGSMAGDKLKQAKEALKYCLTRLQKDDRFAIIAFSTDVDELTTGLTEASPTAIREASAKIEALEARGGTAVFDALKKACETAGKSNRLIMIVFLTDGRPTVGATDIDEILRVVPKDKAFRARVFAFGVGTDLNTDLLDRLATENRGAQQYVSATEDIELKVSNFYEKIATPVLSDVVVTVDGIELRDLYPRQIPDIFAGGQVLLFGRYRGEGRHRVTARGKVRDQEQTFTCEADFDGNDHNEFIPAIWAHRKVAYLMEEIRLRGHNKELEDEIVALGKRYGIMTPYTSFLVAEDEPAARRAENTERRHDFERLKGGAGGVALSRGVSDAKEAAMSPVAAGSDTIGLVLNDGSGSTAGRDGDRARRQAEAMEHGIKRVADKVFYLKDDGFYYDSLFEENTRPRIVAIKYLSDEYFELLDRHKEIGRYLAGGPKLVICIGRDIYKITE